VTIDPLTYVKDAPDQFENDLAALAKEHGAQRNANRPLPRRPRLPRCSLQSRWRSFRYPSLLTVRPSC
jgi:hypothetical protein